VTGGATRKGRLIPLRRIEGAANEISDEALLTACARGEASAMGALFDRHAARVARFLRRVSRETGPDVADLLQATFLEVQRSAKRFRGRSTVATWILAIAANIASHYARGERRRRNMEAALATTPKGHVKTPSEDAERAQLLSRLAAGIDALSPDLRMIYVMCEIEEVTGREAADAMRISEPGVWRRLHDAKVFLRRFIERDDE
jgi:RNA polymerase sigma-70 factor (ECF subfamily)